MLTWRQNSRDCLSVQRLADVWQSVAVSVVIESLRRDLVHVLLQKSMSVGPDRLQLAQVYTIYEYTEGL